MVLFIFFYLGDIGVCLRKKKRTLTAVVCGNGCGEIAVILLAEHSRKLVSLLGSRWKCCRTLLYLCHFYISPWIRKLD